MTDKARFFKKNNGSNWGPTGLNQAQNKFFAMRFFDGLKFGPNGPKWGSELDFSPFSQVCLINFPLNYIGLLLGTMCN